jgi:hypothetical protein
MMRGMQTPTPDRYAALRRIQTPLGHDLSTRVETYAHQQPVTRRVGIIREWPIAGDTPPPAQEVAAQLEQRTALDRHDDCAGQCERHGGAMPGPLFDTIRHRVDVIRDYVNACDEDEMPIGACRDCGEPWDMHPRTCINTPGGYLRSVDV